MIVVDASAWVTALVDDGPSGDGARSVLASDHDWAVAGHTQLEVLRTLLRYERAGLLTARAADELAVAVAATTVRAGALDPTALLKVWRVRDRISVYHAPCAVLARELQVPLVTTDGRLARAARMLDIDVIIPGEAA